MSLYICAKHGFTGPMACCAQAVRKIFLGPQPPTTLTFSNAVLPLTADNHAAGAASDWQHDPKVELAQLAVKAAISGGDIDGALYWLCDAVAECVVKGGWEPAA